MYSYICLVERRGSNLMFYTFITTFYAVFTTQCFQAFGLTMNCKRLTKLNVRFSRKTYLRVLTELVMWSWLCIIQLLMVYAILS